MTVDHCCSDDGDGTNAVAPLGGDWANEFTDAANGNFTLVAGGNLVGAGTDDPSSGLFLDDITGTTRINPWDIGAFGLFEVVSTITSVSDSPDPEESGNDITFSVDWSDTEGIKMLVCKTNSITAATPACDGGEWCSNKNDWDSTDPITCSYTLTDSEIGVNDYYIFVCDNEPTCSASTSGTFTAESVGVSTKVFKGGTNFKGGVIK